MRINEVVGVLLLGFLAFDLYLKPSLEDSVYDLDMEAMCIIITILHTFSASNLFFASST